MSDITTITFEGEDTPGTPGGRIKQALDDSYILIVDDWNWANVQNGTWDALRDLGYGLISKLEIKTTNDNTYPKLADHFSDWHNGYLIAAIEKE